MCEREADWVLGHTDSRLQLSSQEVHFFCENSGYIQCKLKLCKRSDFYNKGISFRCIRESMPLCSPLLHVNTVVLHSLKIVRDMNKTGTYKSIYSASL